jgi:CRP/FNR family transcriptional regulator
MGAQSTRPGAADLLNDQSPLPPERVELLLKADRRLVRAFQALSPTLFEARAPLVQTGERPTHVFRLHGGWAARERVLEDGRVAILSTYLPGDLIGLDGLFSARASDTVVALAPASCQAMPLGELARLLEQDAAAALRVAQLLDRERRRAERLAVGLGRCDAEERVAAFLLDVYERLRSNALASHRSFRLPLTQQQIGNHLGLKVVHVNRMLRNLRAKGIALVSRNTVVITNLGELRRLAARTTALLAAPAPAVSEGNSPSFSNRFPAEASGNQS